MMGDIFFVSKPLAGNAIISGDDEGRVIQRRTFPRIIEDFTARCGWSLLKAFILSCTSGAVTPVVVVVQSFAPVVVDDTTSKHGKVS